MKISVYQCYHGDKWVPLSFNRFGKQILQAFKLEIEKDYLAHTTAMERETELTAAKIHEAAATSLHASSGSQHDSGSILE